MIKLRNGFVGMALLAGVLLAPAAWAGQLKDGIYWTDKQDFGRAQDILESYTRQFPNDPRPYFYLAKCYESKFLISKVDEALSSYRRLSERRNKIFQLLADAEPIPTYRAMLKDEPTDLSARLLLIASYLQNTAPMMAMAELQAIQPSQVPNELNDILHGMWGVTYQQQGNLAMARSELKECWRLNVNNPLPAKLLPEIDLAERTQVPAMQTDRGSMSNARSFELTLKLGRDLLTEGNLDGAVEALSQALEAKPNHPEAKALLVQAQRRGAEKYYQQGVQFMRDQKFGSAHESFSQALKLDPQFTKALVAAQDAKGKADAQERELRR